jgi:hypothetical protein
MMAKTIWTARRGNKTLLVERSVDMAAVMIDVVEC